MGQEVCLRIRIGSETVITTDQIIYSVKTAIKEFGNFGGEVRRSIRGGRGGG
jgi:hypothetical protein